jgi:ubiquinone/menaquinone biosynthesis C-methylase UbiE
MTAAPDHNQELRRQFAIQASRFESYVTGQGNRDVMDWILDNLDLQPGHVVLDVAAGTGLVGRKMAPHVGRVIALDTTPQMLAEGRAYARQEGLENISFEEGDARELPYADGTFDLVTCRIAVHHFPDPRAQMQEMVRVCRPGGRVAIIDILTSDDPAVAEAHNRLERLRDPSHTRSLTLAELQALVENSGLEIVRSSGFQGERTVEDWMDLTNTPSETRRVIVSQLEGELAGGSATGMHPFRDDGRLMFYHSWALLVGQKAAA